LAAIEAPDPVVAHVAGRLAAADAPPIGELARDTGFTRQYLGRLFRDHVGISPKQLARVARLQRAMSSLLAGGEPAGVAASAGYFDQAHMIRDFHDLVGLTPSAACAAEPGSIRPIRSLYRAA
ncbi:MAG: helix-turn-helix transcriptional regulator, partial [Acidobacteriota bacterium]